MEYEIQMEAFEVSSDKNNISTAEVKIVFRRRMEYHVTNTFLQTLILVSIGFMSLFFEVDNFTDRIMVSLTTMLVVATITSSIQSVSHHNLNYTNASSNCPHPELAQDILLQID